MAAFLNSTCFGPSFSFCLSSVPIAIRGTIAALIMLLANISGGVGPFLVGVASDTLGAAGFSAPLGLALAGVTLFNLVAGPFYFHAAGRT
jgi:hypothetical protein